MLLTLCVSERSLLSVILPAREAEGRDAQNRTKRPAAV